VVVVYLIPEQVDYFIIITIFILLFTGLPHTAAEQQLMETYKKKPNPKLKATYNKDLFVRNVSEMSHKTSALSSPLLDLEQDICIEHSDLKASINEGWISSDGFFVRSSPMKTPN
jgi:hypothetical protein